MSRRTPPASHSVTELMWESHWPTSSTESSSVVGSTHSHIRELLNLSNAVINTGPDPLIVVFEIAFLTCESAEDLRNSGMNFKLLNMTREVT